MKQTAPLPENPVRPRRRRRDFEVGQEAVALELESAPQEPEEHLADLPKPSLKARVLSWLVSPSAPFVVGGALIAAACGYAAASYSPLSTAAPRIVTFDPVKFMNSQRAAASVLVAGGASSSASDLALSLTQVAKKAQEVIKEEAGGAVVVVKQVLVNPEVEDITDRVLERFGLPTEVPTITTGVKDWTSTADIAPTDGAFSSGNLREDYREELARKGAAAKKNEVQEEMLP